MTKHGEAWRRLVTYHLETEVPGGDDVWPRLAEELRLQQLASARAADSDPGAPPRRLTRWNRLWRRLPNAFAGLVAALLVLVTVLPAAWDRPASPEPAGANPATLHGGPVLTSVKRRALIDHNDDTGLSELQQIASEINISLLVPTHVPPAFPLGPVVERLTAESVRLTYLTSDYEPGLHVMMGLAGTGPDIAEGAQGRPISIRSDLTGHYVNTDGGLTLWWLEGRTYFAISGPDLTERQARIIADHMVPIGFIRTD